MTANRPPPEPERRQDYPSIVFLLEALRQENNVINTRIENCERKQAEIETKHSQFAHDNDYFHSVSKQFEQLKNDIRWIKWISQAVGAVLIFLFGDVIKKKAGL